MEVRPLHPLFAAELLGADLSEEPGPELIRTVEDAMAKYAVLVVRDQGHVGDLEHIRFSRAFGPLELPPELGFRKAARKRRFAATPPPTTTERKRCVCAASNVLRTNTSTTAS